MLHRRRSALATLLLPAVIASPWLPVDHAAATAPIDDVLSGRWQVSHLCLTVCKGTQRFTEVVRRRTGTTYTGTGGEVEVLDKLGSQVLVHAPDNAVILTIRQPRRLMTGQGIAANGATFSVTWQCVAAATTHAGFEPRAKVVC